MQVGHALLPIFSLLSHSCVNNTRYTQVQHLHNHVELSSFQWRQSSDPRWENACESSEANLQGRGGESSCVLDALCTISAICIVHSLSHSFFWIADNHKIHQSFLIKGDNPVPGPKRRQRRSPAWNSTKLVRHVVQIIGPPFLQAVQKELLMFVTAHFRMFVCSCQRCQDPTELGTHASTMVWPKCNWSNNIEVG